MHNYLKVRKWKCLGIRKAERKSVELFGLTDIQLEAQEWFAMSQFQMQKLLPLLHTKRRPCKQKQNPYLVAGYLRPVHAYVEYVVSCPAAVDAEAVVAVHAGKIEAAAGALDLEKQKGKNYGLLYKINQTVEWD